MPSGAGSNRGNWLGASGDSGIEIPSGNTKSSLLSLSSLRLSVEQWLLDLIIFLCESLVIVPRGSKFSRR